MLPMFCSAPPRMGKSAVALLLSSLAVKLGGRVFYGVAPNKVVPVNEMLHKVRTALQWTPKPLPLTNYTKRQRLAVAASAARTTGQGLMVNDNDRPMHDNLHIVFYSHHVPTTELKAVIARIDKLSKTPGEWVLHVRDEAQFLVKDSSYYYKEDRTVKAIAEYHQGWKRPPELLEQLRGTYPLKCGLSLCVSATLLPVLTETQLVGSVPYEFWDRIDADDQERDSRDARAAWLGIHNAGPRMVAVLSPQRGNLHVSDATPYWIKEHYLKLEGVDQSYYGTMEHVEPWRAEGEAKVTYMSEGMWKLDEESVADNYPELKQQLALLQAKGDESVPGMPRVYSPVVYAPSGDAVAVLSHAREWLDEAPALERVGRYREPVGYYYDYHWFIPMYLLSPTRTQRGDGGTADWVQQIFKLAWLRMHRWFTEGASETTPRHFKAYNKGDLRERYGMIALVRKRRERRRAPALLALLAERRRRQGGRAAGLLLRPGRPREPPRGAHLWALAFVGILVRIICRFRSRRVLRTRAGQDAADGQVALREKQIPRGAQQGDGQDEEEQACQPGAELQRQLQERLKPREHTFDPDLAADADMSKLLVNLNGIVLKLTTTRHENAQSAISYYERVYGIRKVLVSGYSMLSAGLTLQHSKYEWDSYEEWGTWDHWVPKYFAVATVRKQLSLSESYQLVGRSFIDLRGGGRPPEGWNVQLLAAQYVIPVLTLYSRLELRFAMLRNMLLAQVFAHLSQFCAPGDRAPL